MKTLSQETGISSETVWDGTSNAGHILQTPPGPSRHQCQGHCVSSQGVGRHSSTCYPGTWEAEAGGPWVWGLYRDTPSQTKHNTTNSHKIREGHISKIPISNLNIYQERTESENMETKSSWDAGHTDLVDEFCTQALPILGTFFFFF